MVLVAAEMGDVLSGLLDKFSDAKKLFRITAYLFKWTSLVQVKSALRVAGALTPLEVKKSKEVWLKYIQQELVEELEKSIGSSKDGSKVTGKFKRLAPFKDCDEIWRVGSRMREFTPFTEDNKPPALLPFENRLTLLLMKDAHDKRHSGVSDTVSQFRLSGYWTPKANCLAKQVKDSCIICRHLDHKPLQQQMGNVPKNQLVSPIGLFGPIECKSDVNKRSTKKIWGMLLVDVNSGAIHCDLVYDYSSQEVLKTLRRFASLRGWPAKISSDPGSQLQSASGCMTSWWPRLQGDLVQISNTQGFSWDVRPGNSPWRQGKSEVSIKIVKRLLKIAIGDSKLTPSELQTVVFEVANLCNERPLGINKSPRSDGSFKVLTANCLLMGRSSNKVPDDSILAESMKKRDRYQLVEQVTRDFWQRWTAEVTPMQVIRQKWHQTSRNLQIGDIVLVHDKSPLKGDYKMAVVESVKVSEDGLVRSGIVSYRIPNSKDALGEYSGGKLVKISRSVQRLSLLLAVEEQPGKMVVNGGKVMLGSNDECET